MTPCRSTLRASTRSSAAWVCRTSRIRRPSSESLRVLRRAGGSASPSGRHPRSPRVFEIIYGAVRRHGSFDVDLPPGPNFFLYADAEKSTESLTAAGFEAVTHTTVPQIWELQSAEDLLESVLHGIVRAAALLRMQPLTSSIASGTRCVRRSRPMPTAASTGFPCLGWCSPR